MRPERQHIFTVPTPNMGWLDQLFDAKAAKRGGIVRRSIASVEREVGRDLFLREVRRRRFHLVETGGQFVVFCHEGRLRVLT